MWATVALAQVKTITTYLGSPTKRADHLYANEYYQEATELYRRAIAQHPQDDRLKLQLAESYHQLNNPEQAVRWYREAIYAPQATAQHQLHYAQALLSTQRVRQAQQWYARYYQANDNDQRAQQRLAGIAQLPKFYEDSLLYSVQTIDANSPGADFAPAFYQDGLVFISSRQTKQPIQQVYRWNETAYLSMFFAPLDKDHRTQGAVPFGQSLGENYHEGPVTFYDEDQQIIFTRNHTQNKKVRHLGLFTARREGDRWKDIVALPFNDEAYSVGHPTVSEDGKTLYFISDMPGGIGGTDLYVSHLENGSWQTPTNVGRPINTEGDEMFPSLHRSGTLYFASTGHQGLGGLDIYKSSTTDPYVENLGYPINSPYDDFGLIMDSTETQGYYASNRGRSASNDQLYQLTVHKQALDILVLDEVARQPIAGAEVTAVGAKALEFALSDTTGKVHFSVSPYESYMLDISREKYQGDAFILDPDMLSDTSGVTVVLKRETGAVELMARLYDTNTDEAIDRTLIHLINVTTGDTISRIADHQGRVRVKVNPKYDYQFAGNVNGHPWDYPVIVGKALDILGQNQINIPIDVPLRDTPLRLTALDEESRQPVAFATVRLIADGEEYTLLHTDQQGVASAKIDPKKSYMISVEPLAHYDDILVLTSEELSPGVDYPVQVLLNTAKDAVSIEAQLYDSISNERLRNTIVRVVNEATGEEKTALSDAQGVLRMKVMAGESYRVLSSPDQLSVKGAGVIVSVEPGKVPESLPLKIATNQPIAPQDIVAINKLSTADTDSAPAKRAAQGQVPPPASAEEPSAETSEVRIMSVASLRASPFTSIEGSSEAAQVWVSVGDQAYQLKSDDGGWYLQGVEGRTRIQGGEGLGDGWWAGSDALHRKIGNIYFGFDQHKITPEAGKELAKVAAFMQTHTELKIEASTHTDSRGPKSYNRVLSQKRAQAIRSYLVAQGIDEEQVYLRFYGEERLVNPCINVSCSEAEHRKNRRGEILVKFK